MTRLPVMMVFSMEALGTRLLAMIKVFKTKAMAAAATRIWIQLMISDFQLTGFFSFSSVFFVSFCSFIGGL